MSGMIRLPRPSGNVVSAALKRLGGPDPLRLGALSGAAVLVGLFLTVLIELITVTGEPRQLLSLAGGALVAATLFARYVRPRTALATGVTALSVGWLWYALVAGIGFEPWGILSDSFELVTGMSALRIHDATIWYLGVTPAPIFLTWYFALRSRYSLAALVGSGAVGFFVLTGDAGPGVTLAAVVGAAATVGFGDLEGSDGTVRAVEYLVPILVVMVVTPLFISVVPAGGASVGLGADTGTELETTAETGTMTEAVVESGSELDIVGSIDLSPEIQFVVESDSGQYWRTGSYDRYTGDGWLRASALPDEGEFRPAEGPTERVDQTVSIEADSAAMPAAWRPFEVESETIDDSDIDTGATLQPERLLDGEDSYSVSSSVPDASEAELRTAGTEYPAAIEETYTQLPSDTPDRLGEATDELVADADDPHEAAVTIERYLRETKEYSLDVDRPDGNIADSFLFEMDAGYCTYFATTMVTMLRSQDIPARMAVGYSTGQRIDEDTWVVRGTNAHAWVEVYFPEHGWIAFEPTPPADLLEAQTDELEAVREVVGEFDGQVLEEQRFDTAQSWQVPAEGIETGEEEATNETDDIGADPIDDGAANGSDLRIEEFETGDPVTITDERSGESDESAAVTGVLSPERLAVLSLLAVGAIVGARRSRYVRRTARRLRLRYRPSGSKADVERSFERLVLLLERRHRERKRGETVREYVRDIDPDPRADRVVTIREQSRYRGTVPESMAQEAIDLVDELEDDR